MPCGAAGLGESGGGGSSVQSLAYHPFVFLALFPQQTCPPSVVRLNILAWREGRREPRGPSKPAVWAGAGCRPPGVGDRAAAGARGSGRLPSPEPPASLAGHAPRALLCPSLAGLLALPRLCTPCGLLPLGASLWLSAPCPRLSGFTRSLSDSSCLSPSVCLWPSLFFPVSGHLYPWGSLRPCPSSLSPL